MATTSVAAHLRVVVARTARRLRQEAGSDLSPSQTPALAAVERHGPLTPSELATCERIQRPTATRVLARLEAAGLGERTGDPAGRRPSAGAAPRASLGALPAAGGALVESLRSRKALYLARRLEGLDAEEPATLERAAD